MEITGAIFDFDGTLMDDTLMWNGLVPRVLTRYTDQDISDHISDTITKSLDESACLFVKNFDVDIFPEQLLDEIKQEFRRAIVEEAKPYEDMVALTKELHEAGIPLAVASCTTKDDVVYALHAHGLDGYFDYVFGGEDADGGKQHPTIYYTVAKAISSAPETTWVFEDADIPVATAAKAGFKVVGLLRDVTWRDMSVLRKTAHIARSEDEPHVTLADLKNYC